MLIGLGMGVAVGMSVSVGVTVGARVFRGGGLVGRGVKVPIEVGTGPGEGRTAGVEVQPASKISERTNKDRRLICVFLRYCPLLPLEHYTERTTPDFTV